MQADVFSCGVVLLAMVIEDEPFFKDGKHLNCPIYKMIKDGKHEEFWASLGENSMKASGLSHEIKDLIIKMIDPNPSKRL